MTQLKITKEATRKPYQKKRKSCPFSGSKKEIDYKDSETRKRIGRFLKDGEVYAHFKCNF